MRNLVYRLLSCLVLTIVIFSAQADAQDLWQQTDASLPYPAFHFTPRGSTNMYVGTIGGGVYHTSNKGGAWNVDTTGLHSYYMYNGLVADGKLLYAGLYGGGVYVSDDAGKTWG